jgi:hypothetical protein
MRSMAFGSGRPGLVGRIGLLLVLSAIVGCGDPSRGKVMGRVLLDGKPLPGGWVTFRPADPRQNSVAALLNAEGCFEAMLPLGKVQVSVDNRELAPRVPRGGGVPKAIPLSPEVKKLIAAGKHPNLPPKSADSNPETVAGNYRKIPNRYHDVQTSGLELNVQPGKQPRDLELTSKE